MTAQQHFTFVSTRTAKEPQAETNVQNSVALVRCNSIGSGRKNRKQMCKKGLSLLFASHDGPQQYFTFISTGTSTHTHTHTLRTSTSLLWPAAPQVGAANTHTHKPTHKHTHTRNKHILTLGSVASSTSSWNSRLSRVAVSGGYTMSLSVVMGLMR